MTAALKKSFLSLALIALCGLGRAALAQMPTLTVSVTHSDVPIPLTIVRGTIVTFQGAITEPMTMTLFALRNDYGEFARGKFLDTWSLPWNTALEHGSTEQIAVLWSQSGSPLTRLTRYNVRLLDAPPFRLAADNAHGKLTLTISPTGTLTAQEFLVSLDGAMTRLVISGQGKGVINTTFFGRGTHTVGASAVLMDGSTTALAPVPFLVTTLPPSARHVPVPAKRKPAHPAKRRRS